MAWELNEGVKPNKDKLRVQNILVFLGHFVNVKKINDQLACLCYRLNCTHKVEQSNKQLMFPSFCFGANLHHAKYVK